jgi:hypothetical protein
MAMISNEAASAVGFILKQTERRDLERSDFDHEIGQTLVLAAVEAVTGRVDIAGKGEGWWPVGGRKRLPA